ncbi:MAG: hypothetical protein LBH00_11570 [Planctomycetaceae bacterium]|jgi:hypothetical protein|nr:hypothetical protein [Planctomycetaceae bacterium]
MRNAFLIFSAVVIFSGCGNRQIPVSGKITLPDSTPVLSGKVIFTTGLCQAEGALDAAGIYSLTLRAKRVFRQAVIKCLPPAHFSARKTIPLTCTVPNENGYDFTVQPSKLYVEEK